MINKKTFFNSLLKKASLDKSYFSLVKPLSTSNVYPVPLCQSKSSLINKPFVSSKADTDKLSKNTISSMKLQVQNATKNTSSSSLSLNSKPLISAKPLISPLPKSLNSLPCSKFSLPLKNKHLETFDHSSSSKSKARFDFQSLPDNYKYDIANYYSMSRKLTDQEKYVYQKMH